MGLSSHNDECSDGLQGQATIRRLQDASKYAFSQVPGLSLVVYLCRQLSLYGNICVPDVADQPRGYAVLASRAKEPSADCRMHLSMHVANWLGHLVVAYLC